MQKSIKKETPNKHLASLLLHSTQSLAFLFYVYAIYKMIPEQLQIMNAVCSMWLWFSVGDCITIIYSSKTLDSIPLEYYCLYFNIILIAYKFRHNIYFYIELMRFNLKVEKYETVLQKV